MIGHVAYALYKRDKRNFYEAFTAKNQRAVTSQELDVFVQSANLPARVAAYRTEAEVALQAFADAVLDEQMDLEKTRLNDNFNEELRRNRSLLRAVWENLLGNLAAAAVVALLALLLYGSRIGFVRLAGDVLGFEVSEKPPIAAPLPGK